jgi:hypothetical protein
MKIFSLVSIKMERFNVKLYILRTIYNFITYYILYTMSCGKNKECKLIYDIKDIKNTGHQFKEKLNALIVLSDTGTGKLGVYDDKLYISWNWFQGIHRTLYGENRTKVIDFLKTNLVDHDIYIQMINTCISYAHHIDLMYEIKQEHYVLRNKWLAGLSVLKEQYKNDTTFIHELKLLESKYNM